MAYEQEGKRFPILAGYDADGKLLGYAFEISGEGFWDVISGYLAVSPDRRTILGIAFYRQSETPGLGAEITKPWFEEQFKDKPICRPTWLPGKAPSTSPCRAGRREITTWTPSPAPRRPAGTCRCSSTTTCARR